MSDKYILQGHKAIPVEDVLEWGRKFDKQDRRVAKTELPNNVEVSTVFLGLDHSFGNGAPLLFETMVFGGKFDGEQDRYTTWEEAEKGHEEMVKKVS